MEAFRLVREGKFTVGMSLQIGAERERREGERERDIAHTLCL